jgi:AAA family ATP:ADP antiporter
MQVKNPSDQPLGDCVGRFPLLSSIAFRSILLFINFFLIILALYQLKPASRSLFIESLGADRLPLVWIATALCMGVFISIYNRLVERCSRLRVVLATCLVIAGLLCGFRLLSGDPGPVTSTCLFVFVDMLGVVLVEQFWSLTDSTYTSREGKRWYGWVGTGGLVGGMLGGWLAGVIIKTTPLKTPDLLLTAAGIVCLIFALTWYMGRTGLYCEVEQVVRPAAPRSGWRALRQSRYLMMIAALLLLAQLASPLVEYQFLNTVEAGYADREARTAFLSFFYSGLGVVSVAVNLLLTPLVHRTLGPIAGLLVQPVLMCLSSWGFFIQPSLFFAGAMRISDRALSYSINRASKELLYIPVNSVLIYQAKAWIDMFGYRTFKIAGSLLILLFTQWLPVIIDLPQLSWFTIGICAAWFGLVLGLRYQYRLVCQAGGSPQ